MSDVIVVGSDGSPTADVAVERAAALAKLTGARDELISGYREDNSLALGAGMYPGDLTEDARKTADDYVEDDVVERRAPHRPAHIGMVREALDDGRLLMGGALGEDPPHGGLLIFRERADAEAFANADPYVSSGLVRAWRLEVWQVVS